MSNAVSTDGTAQRVQGGEQEAVASATTQMLDREVAERLTKGKDGLISKAHTYICQSIVKKDVKFSR